MPAEDIVSRILRLPGYRTYDTEFDETTGAVTPWVTVVEAHQVCCRRCGVKVRRLDKRALLSWEPAAAAAPALHGRGRDLLEKGPVPVGGLGPRGVQASVGGRGAQARDPASVLHQYLPPRRRRSVRAVCVNMWGALSAEPREHLPQAAIIFDKFHVMTDINGAVDEIPPPGGRLDPQDHTAAPLRSHGSFLGTPTVSPAVE